MMVTTNTKAALSQALHNFVKKSFGGVDVRLLFEKDGHFVMYGPE